jgi:hypothetical protein
MKEKSIDDEQFVHSAYVSVCNRASAPIHWKKQNISSKFIAPLPCDPLILSIIEIQTEHSWTIPINTKTQNFVYKVCYTLSNIKHDDSKKYIC